MDTHTHTHTTMVFLGIKPKMIQHVCFKYCYVMLNLFFVRDDSDICLITLSSNHEILWRQESFWAPCFMVQDSKTSTLVWMVSALKLQLSKKPRITARPSNACPALQQLRRGALCGKVGRSGRSGTFVSLGLVVCDLPLEKDTTIMSYESILFNFPR